MTTSREEDYLEAILHIVEKKGYAKVGDISKHLHCSAATVTEMFGRLSEKGYVNYEKYGGVTLTEEGRRIGIEIDRRHLIIKGFLEILGMEGSIADEDACQIEHSLHPQTVDRLRGFIEFVRSSPDDMCWVARYRSFLETGTADTSECPMREDRKSA